MYKNRELICTISYEFDNSDGSVDQFVEQTRRELAETEDILSDVLSIEGNIRRTLIDLDSRGLLPNCEVAKRWQQTYSTYYKFKRLFE